MQSDFTLSFPSMFIRAVGAMKSQSLIFFSHSEVVKGLKGLNSSLFTVSFKVTAWLSCKYCTLSECIYAYIRFCIIASALIHFFFFFSNQWLHLCAEELSF